MFWAFGTAPDGAFANDIFPYSYSTVEVEDKTTVSGIYLSWFLRKPPTINEFWDFLPL